MLGEEALEVLKPVPAVPELEGSAANTFVTDAVILTRRCPSVLRHRSRLLHLPFTDDRHQHSHRSFGVREKLGNEGTGQRIDFRLICRQARPHYWLVG